MFLSIITALDLPQKKNAEQAKEKRAWNESRNGLTDFMAQTISKILSSRVLYGGPHQRLQNRARSCNHLQASWYHNFQFLSAVLRSKHKSPRLCDHFSCSFRSTTNLSLHNEVLLSFNGRPVYPIATIFFSLNFRADARTFYSKKWDPGYWGKRNYFEHSLTSSLNRDKLQNQLSFSLPFLRFLSHNFTKNTNLLAQWLVQHNFSVINEQLLA